ncbi:MAG TPA: acyl carrier protein [Bacteroidetes bacterium]|nr:acyl carrier protein [Caldisericaceae bacterium]HHE64639.1 acyl carrier protein [Bacteroidota bacterium]
MDMHQQIINFLYDESLKDEFKELDYDDSLLELGIIDSVKMLDLIGFIEERFGVQVDDDDLYPENFDSINAIVNYINSKKNN